MIKVKFTDSLPPVSDIELANLEKLIGVNLPEEMKSIYKNYNGGQPQPSCAHDKVNIYPINSFYFRNEIIES